MLRTATLDDLDALVALEQHCFDGDRLSRRSLRRMITNANAGLLVDDALRGYALVLFRAGSLAARLYSVAVAPVARGSGLGTALMHAVEQAAHDRGCNAMRLEVRQDNQAALALYETLGYRRTGMKPDYYDDHMAAVCMEKSLVAEEAR
jgi:ribosomal protein S18 acetylase RimI-like enzyme